jgi:hypothetical protein
VRFYLTVLLANGKRDLAARGRRDRQLEMALVQLTADLRDEGHNHLVQSFTAQINCVPFLAIEGGGREEVAWAGMTNPLADRSLGQADRDGDAPIGSFNLDFVFRFQPGPLTLFGSGDRNRADAVVGFDAARRVLIAQEFQELLERLAPYGPLRLPVPRA